MLTALTQVNNSYADATEDKASPTTLLADKWMKRLETARWKNFICYSFKHIYIPT